MSHRRVEKLLRDRERAMRALRASLDSLSPIFLPSCLVTAPAADNGVCLDGVSGRRRVEIRHQAHISLTAIRRPATAGAPGLSQPVLGAVNDGIKEVLATARRSRSGAPAHTDCLPHQHLFLAGGGSLAVVGRAWCMLLRTCLNYPFVSKSTLFVDPGSLRRWRRRTVGVERHCVARSG